MLYLFEEYKINLWREFMKKQKLLGIFLISTMLLCGCTKMEKDVSYDTDLYGTYSWTISAPEISFESKSTYKINEDNTYENSAYKKSEGQTTEKNDSGKIIETNSINNEITKIVMEDKSYIDTIFYKYKNMLGEFYNIEIPQKSKFQLFLQNPNSNLNEGIVFNDDGKYHYCTNYDNCNDDKNSFTKYKKSGNYIYQLIPNKEWKIFLYITEDGIFSPEYFKEK